MAREAVLKAHASSISVCSNDLLAPRESARGTVSLLSVKNKSDERTRRDAQLRVTAARSAAVTIILLQFVICKNPTHSITFCQ